MADIKVLRARLYNELWQSPLYQDLIKELRTRRPHIPAWNTKDDNTREIQKALSQREHHDLIMAILDPMGDKAA